MKRTLLTSAILAGTMVVSLAAQTAGDREANQQGRIAQGDATGQLTGPETRNLEHKEKKVNKEVRRDRRANGGTLTPGEKAKVNRQQNHISKDIAKDKHNDQVQ